MPERGTASSFHRIGDLLPGLTDAGEIALTAAVVLASGYAKGFPEQRTGCGGRVGLYPMGFGL